jgi:hypothetical protein
MNSQKKSIKSQTKPIKIQIFLLFIDFVCGFCCQAMKAVISNENFTCAALRSL